MTDAAVLTKPFVTTAGDYFGVVLSAWMRIYGWCLLLPIIFFLAIGLILDDVRWYIVALLTVFIIAPMLMSFLYPYYMLTPEARRAVLPRKVSVNPDGSLTIIYVPRSDIDNAAELSAPESDIDLTAPAAGGDTVDVIPETVPDPEIIPASHIAGRRVTSRFVVYMLRARRMQFVIIPHSSFPRP